MTEGKKIVAIIPARYQSSRFPGKPLVNIYGKPMIWWVYHQCKKVDEFDAVHIATDSQKIYDVCSSYGMDVLMTSDRHQTGTDRLGEVATKINADFYVNIQGDEPIIEPETIQRIVHYHFQHPEVQIINTMTRLHEDDDVTVNTIVKVVAADNGDLLYLSRSPIPCSKCGEPVKYHKHLGLYGLTKEALQFFAQTERTTIEKIEDIEMMRFLESGYRIKIIAVNSRSVGVDCPGDIAKVETAMKEMGIVAQ